METKRCSKCENELPLSAFYQRTGAKSHHSACKVCERRQLSGQRVGWLVREVQEWAESRTVSNLPPPPNTGAPKHKEAA